MQTFAHQDDIAPKAQMNQNFVQPEHLAMHQVCRTLVNAPLAQKDIIARMLVKQMKQGYARKVISVSRVLKVLWRRSVQWENTVQLALMYQKTVLLVPFLMKLACRKLSSVLTVQLGHTVLNQDEHTPQDNAELGFTVLMGPVLIMLCRVLLVYIVPQEVPLQRTAQPNHSPMPQSNLVAKTVLQDIIVSLKM